MNSTVGIGRKGGDIGRGRYTVEVDREDIDKVIDS